MLEGIPIDIGNLSGWGVVAILVVMLLTGRINAYGTGLGNSWHALYASGHWPIG